LILVPLLRYAYGSDYINSYCTLIHIDEKVKNHLILYLIATMVNLAPITSALAVDRLFFSTFDDAGTTLVPQRVIREAYRRLGYEIEIYYLPGERAIHSANNGMVDGELYRIAKEMYQNLIIVPVPICYIKHSVFTKNANFQPDGWESLKPFSAISLRGYKYAEKKLKEHGIRYHLVNDFNKMLELLEEGRYDIGLMNMLDGLKAMKSLGIKDIKALEPPLDSLPLYHFLHRKNKELVPLIGEKLKALKEEGFVKDVENQVLSELLEE